MTRAMCGVVVDECYELEVGAVFEADELVFCFSVAVATAGCDCEFVGYPGGKVLELGVGD